MTTLSPRTLNASRGILFRRRHGPFRTETATMRLHRVPSSTAPLRTPMPRVFPNQTSEPSSSVWSRIRESWDNGTILLSLGWSGVALLLLDQYLQYQLFQQEPLDKDEMIEELVYNAQLQRQRLQEEYQNHKCLYKCVITNADAHMGGSHGLRNVQTGDVVEVLEERVGLGQAYHMCRRKSDTSNDTDVEIGWFPIRYLQRVPWWKRPFV